MDSAVLLAPLYTTTRHEGMGKSPGALKKAGLVSAFGKGAKSQEVKLPKLKKDTPGANIKNLDFFSECTERIYRQARTLDADLAVAVGGECSITVGSLAGLSEMYPGKPGVLWMDSHGDFNTPETSPSGYIGGMCLAIACGRGPRLSQEVEARRPMVTEERLVHVGSRALDPPEVSAFNNSPAKLFTTQQVRSTGAAEVGAEAARHLSNRADWLVCHLDVDVVDPSLIPAVSYPTPGGLALEEVRTLLDAMVKTEKLRVVELAAYNAGADKGGKSAKTIVKLMKEVFG